MIGLKDEELLEQFVAGQRDAGDELIRRHQVAAYQWAYRILQQEADAEDAVQLSFMKAFKNALAFRRKASFRTWLLCIVRGTSLGIRRRRKATPEAFAADATYACDPRTPLHGLMEREEEVAAKRLHVTIQRILKSRGTPEMRRVLRLRMRGWTFAKIAEELGCCERTARSLRDRLRTLVLKEIATRRGSRGRSPLVFLVPHIIPDPLVEFG
jgi:RNA polymerase sigma-70 factor (ECF subfamily)